MSLMEQRSIDEVQLDAAFCGDSLLSDPPKEDGETSCAYSLTPPPSARTYNDEAEIPIRGSVTAIWSPVARSSDLMSPNLEEQPPSTRVLTPLSEPFYLNIDNEFKGAVTGNVRGHATPQVTVTRRAFPEQTSTGRSPPISLPLLKIPTVDISVDPNISYNPDDGICPNYERSAASETSVFIDHSSGEQGDDDLLTPNIAYDRDEKHTDSHEHSDNGGVGDTEELSDETRCLLSLNRSSRRRHDGDESPNAKTAACVDFVIFRPFYPLGSTVKESTGQRRPFDIQCRLTVLPTPVSHPRSHTSQAQHVNNFTKLPAYIPQFTIPSHSLVVVEFLRTELAGPQICEGCITLPARLFQLIAAQELFIPSGSHQYLKTLFREYTYKSASLEFPLRQPDGDLSSCIQNEHEAEQHLIKMAREMFSQDATSLPSAFLQIQCTTQRIQPAVSPMPLRQALSSRRERLTLCTVRTPSGWWSTRRCTTKPFGRGWDGLAQKTERPSRWSDTTDPLPSTRLVPTVVEKNKAQCASKSAAITSQFTDQGIIDNSGVENVTARPAYYPQKQQHQHLASERHRSRPHVPALRGLREVKACCSSEHQECNGSNPAGGERGPAPPWSALPGLGTLPHCNLNQANCETSRHSISCYETFREDPPVPFLRRRSGSVSNTCDGKSARRSRSDSSYLSVSKIPRSDALSYQHFPSCDSSSCSRLSALSTESFRGFYRRKLSPYRDGGRRSNHHQTRQPCINIAILGSSCPSQQWTQQGHPDSKHQQYISMTREREGQQECHRSSARRGVCYSVIYSQQNHEDPSEDCYYVPHSYSSTAAAHTGSLRGRGDCCHAVCREEEIRILHSQRPDVETTNNRGGQTGARTDDLMENKTALVSLREVNVSTDSDHKDGNCLVGQSQVGSRNDRYDRLALRVKNEKARSPQTFGGLSSITMSQDTTATPPTSSSMAHPSLQQQPSSFLRAATRTKEILHHACGSRWLPPSYQTTDEPLPRRMSEEEASPPSRGAIPMEKGGTAVKAASAAYAAEFETSLLAETNTADLYRYTYVMLSPSTVHVVLPASFKRRFFSLTSLLFSIISFFVSFCGISTLIHHHNAPLMLSALDKVPLEVSELRHDNGIPSKSNQRSLESGGAMEVTFLPSAKFRHVKFQKLSYHLCYTLCDYAHHRAQDTIHNYLKPVLTYLFRWFR